MEILLTLLIAISLSMDTFSLSLAYGTLNMSKKNILTLSTIVGIYHFIMPLIGLFLGTIILSFLPIKPKIITAIVLIVIGIQMLLGDSKNKKEIKNLNPFEMLLFGLAVSIDSFSIGLGLKEINSNYSLAALIFFIVSFMFTYVGLLLGKKINNLIGNISTILGGLSLIIIGICFLL